MIVKVLAKTKHIDVKYHFIRDMLEDKLMKLVKVHTYDNPTDLMTKGLLVIKNPF